MLSLNKILIRVLLIAMVALCYEAEIAQAADQEVQVLSFNILRTNPGISQNEKVNRIAEIVNTTGADIIGFQEGENHVNSVFSQLGGASAGWHLHQQTAMDGVIGGAYIMSKFPITLISNNGHGVQLQLDVDTTAWLFNNHLPFGPYGPYFVRDNPGASTQAYLDSTQPTYNTMQRVLNDIAASTTIKDSVFLTGDFNDPSHLDWTQEAADAGLHFGEVVPWITSNMVQDAGFRDSYRDTFPDAVNHLGETWSPLHPADVQDRIDFVYYRGDLITLTDSQVVGEVGAPLLGNVDVPIANYPSDHRAVVSSFTISPLLVGDLDADGDLDSEDWALYRIGLHADLSGLTPQQAHRMGDLNADFLNNHADFVLFKNSYERKNGVGAFASMMAESNSVPEPTSLLLVMHSGVMIGMIFPRALNANSSVRIGLH